MTIALLTDGIYPCVIGGMQKHSYYLAKYLAKAGHMVDVYHPTPAAGKADYKSHFTETELANLRFFEVPFPSLGKSPGHYIRESYAFSQALLEKYRKQKQPDFIYAKGFTAWGFLHRKTQGEKFPPIGVNFHGYEMFQPAASPVEWMKYALLLRSPVKFCVRHADFLFSYGGKITGIIAGLGVPANRIIEIPTGIGEEWLHPGKLHEDNMRRFIFVGRDERRKGINELNYAISRLKTMHREKAEFHFVGPVREQKKLKKTNVIYHGEIRDSEKIRKILRTCDILICPSYSEGMPNVILEGMASGCTVIATDVGAVALLLDESNGMLVEAGNKQALLSALTSMLEMPPEKLMDLKKNAVKKAAKYTWEAIVSETIEKLNKIIHKAQNE